MTALWISLLLMAALATGLVLLPLMRRPGAEADAAEHDLAVYRDQLTELKRDLDRGLIAAGPAEAARVEIERRILRSAGGTAPRVAPTRPRNVALIVVLAVIVPAGALLAYLQIGAPGLPDMPLSARLAPDRPAGGMPDAAEFARLTDQLAARLAQNPRDVQGWLMLGRSQRVLGRPAESLSALRQGLAAAGGVDGAPPELLAELGEAIVLVEDGRIVDEARDLFARAARDPLQVKARHYLAAARAQDNDLRGALALWRGLEADSPPDAPWLPPLREQIRRIAAELNVDPASVAPEGSRQVVAAPVARDPMAGAPVAPAMPPREAVEAASRMTPQEREAFIRGMVDRLAGRLAENPDDAEGWVRLGRAYVVLGEAQRSREAFGRAASLFRRDLDALPADSPQRRVLQQRIEEIDGRS